MASSAEFVEYVCKQIGEAGEITYKKMFGEYGVYCNGKIIGLVCDNQFYVKKTKAGEELLSDINEAPPYPGANPCFLIDDLDDRRELARLISATYSELPEPKPKKKKSDPKESEKKTMK